MSSIYKTGSEFEIALFELMKEHDYVLKCSAERDFGKIILSVECQSELDEKE